MTNTSEQTYLPSTTDNELLPVVDEDNRVLRGERRSEIHRLKLRHRAVHIVLVNPNGDLLLQCRSLEKDSYPGWWDISVGGHVDYGETYLEAAVRELREELGVDAPICEVARRSAAPDSGWEFVRIYECLHQGKVHFPASEISETRWVSARELCAHAHCDPERQEWRITPSGLASIRLWARERGIT